jgi:very-short-patch-repair endonuclease
MPGSRSARLDDVEADVALEQLGGFATRAALLHAGVTRHGLDVALRAGRVRRMRRGVYGLGPQDGWDVVRAAAVALRATVSHDSAAVLWGMELVHRPVPQVTVPRDHSRRCHPGVVVHRRAVSGTVVRAGLRTTDPLRTVLDCARVLPLPEAVVVADSALRQGLVSIDALQAAAGRATGPGAARVRRVARTADPSSGSVLESLLRVLLVLHGLTPERTQFELRERGRVRARVDFAWPRARLLVEADGFTFHRDRSDYRRDRRRANLACRLGWRLLRFSWEDVRFDPEYVVDAVRHELTKRPARVA